MKKILASLLIVSFFVILNASTNNLLEAINLLAEKLEYKTSVSQLIKISVSAIFALILGFYLIVFKDNTKKIREKAEAFLEISLIKLLSKARFVASSLLVIAFVLAIKQQTAEIFFVYLFTAVLFYSYSLLFDFLKKKKVENQASN